MKKFHILNYLLHRIDYGSEQNTDICEKICFLADNYQAQKAVDVVVAVKLNKVSFENNMHRPAIEPGSHAWEACILPLNHRCLWI